MSASLASLPPPTAADLNRSRELTHVIVAAIDRDGGAIPFGRFMDMALYTPELGYYATGAGGRFGRQGDFVTAPELSPAFGYCVAKQCAQILSELRRQGQTAMILELGAGTGRLAADILRTLRDDNCPPDAYHIVEPAAGLQQRQQCLLQPLGDKLSVPMRWFRQLPAQPFCGVIVANEVFDAFPCERFVCDGDIDRPQQDYVAYERHGDKLRFVWRRRPAQPALQAYVREKLTAYATDWPSPYCSEIHLTLPRRLHDIGKALHAGTVLLFDYGTARAEYYHPQRTQGSLRCYYRHRVHDAPLILCGLQDITAHIDFTAVAESALAAGFTVAGFCRQAAFLLACDIQAAARTATVAQQSALRKLLLPGEMGEAIKVMALHKSATARTEPLRGFTVNDRRVQL